MPIVDRELVSQEIPDDLSKIPNVPLGIFIEKAIEKNVEEQGDGKWLTDVSTGKSMTYTQLLSNMKSVASALRKRGFKTGDNLMVISCNHVELPLMSMAVWRAGGSQACLGVNLPKDVIEMRIKEVGSKFVLTDYARAGLIVDVVKGLDFVREVFVIGDKHVEGCTLFNELLLDSGEACPEYLHDVDGNTTAWMAYTSGTTGLSKCIVLSNRMVVGSFARFQRPGKKMSIKFLFVNPMNNTGGLSMALGTSLGKLDNYCLSSFSEENLLAAITQVKPLAVSLFPAHVAWLCKYPDLSQHDLSSIMSVSVMGSCVNQIYERQIFDKLPNLLFFRNVYGMSEIGLICQGAASTNFFAMDKPKAVEEHVFGSVGKVAPFCKIKVIDRDTGEKLGPNQVGEICVRSPFMLTEYLNRPEETADFLRDGWAHTGDKGYYDESECLFIIGRYKELIKYRNVHVVPTNVEKHMMTHPAIEDVAVVGLPHDEDGERPLAFVVLSEGCKVTAEELISYTNEKVMEEEKLRGGIRFIEKIPRNDLGKIIRPALMQL